MKKRSQRLLLLGAALLALARCGDDSPVVTQNFAPLHYDYLSKLRLNVGAVNIQDRSLPAGPQDVAASSPAVPAQALQQMARDRLFAAGTAGQAAFVVDQASIIRGPDGALDGRLAVHIDISGGGGQAGFAKAQVSRQYMPGSEPNDGSATLYTFTRQMMDDMNVELEFQIKRSLGAYLVAPGSAPAPVVAQPLTPPGTPPAMPAPPAPPPAGPGDAVPPPEAPTDGYQDPAAPAPQQMSPRPGYLQLPPPG